MKQSAKNSQPFELSKFFPYKLAILSNRISNLIARDYAERFDLTVPQWRVIMVVHNAGKATASEIATMTLMDRVRVTRTLQALIDREIVTRVASQTDGRSAFISLSPKGQEIYEQVAPLAIAYEEKVLGSLDEEKRSALEELLEQLDKQVTSLEEEA